MQLGASRVISNSGFGIVFQLGMAVDDLVSKRIEKNIKIMNMSVFYGIDSTLRQKINTAANNGIVMVTIAGNNGVSGGAVTDPGRAAMALTMAGANDINQLTEYTSL